MLLAVTDETILKIAELLFSFLTAMGIGWLALQNRKIKTETGEQTQTLAKVDRKLNSIHSDVSDIMDSRPNSDEKGM